MFSDSIHPRKNYGDRVADGFSITLDALSTFVMIALAVIVGIIVGIFGWPFALISWLNEKLK